MIEERGRLQKLNPWTAHGEMRSKWPYSARLITEGAYRSITPYRKRVGIQKS
jgi:hypothetical protein